MALFRYVGLLFIVTSVFDDPVHVGENTVTAPPSDPPSLVALPPPLLPPDPPSLPLWAGHSTVHMQCTTAIVFSIRAEAAEQKGATASPKLPINTFF